MCRSAPAKLPVESQFKACSVSFASEVTLSQSPQLDILHFDWTDDEVQKYETLAKTRAIARDYANRARTALAPFPNSPAKETLEVALDFVLERDR